MNRCAENCKGNLVGASEDGYMVRLSADLLLYGNGSKRIERDLTAAGCKSMIQDGMNAALVDNIYPFISRLTDDDH